MHLAVGAGLSAAVGVIGRTAEADVRAGDGGFGSCYTYSCSKGLLFISEIICFNFNMFFKSFFLVYNMFGKQYFGFPFRFLVQQRKNSLREWCSLKIMFSFFVSLAGAFVGCSLKGSIVTTRTQENARFYGNQSITASDILLGSLPRPPAAAILYRALTDLYQKINK